MGRLFISPFLPALGENIGQGGEKLFTTFERRENVEKLIVMLEKPKAEPEKIKEEQTKEAEETPKKRGLRQFLPF